MKKLLPVALLLLLVNLSACKKEIEPERDLTSEIEGTYSIYEIVVDGKVTTLPQNGVKGGITFTRTSLNTATMRVVFTDNGQTAADSQVTVYLGLESNGLIIDLFDDEARKSKFGEVPKNRVFLNSTSADGTRTRISGQR